jgi:hypothetical protein
MAISYFIDRNKANVNHARFPADSAPALVSGGLAFFILVFAATGQIPRQEIDTAVKIV